MNSYTSENENENIGVPARRKGRDMALHVRAASLVVAGAAVGAAWIGMQGDQRAHVVAQDVPASRVSVIIHDVSRPSLPAETFSPPEPVEHSASLASAVSPDLKPAIPAVNVIPPAPDASPPAEEPHAEPPSEEATVQQYSVNWDAIAACESTNNWSINTGNGFSGGLQFVPSTWSGYGGGEFAPMAHQATREQQIVVAERVLRGQGIGAWPVCGRRG